MLCDLREACCPTDCEEIPSSARELCQGCCFSTYGSLRFFANVTCRLVQCIAKPPDYVLFVACFLWAMLWFASLKAMGTAPAHHPLLWSNLANVNGILLLLLVAAIKQLVSNEIIFSQFCEDISFATFHFLKPGSGVWKHVGGGRFTLNSLSLFFFF